MAIDPIPSAEVSQVLFTLASKLERYTSALKFPPRQRQFWEAVIEQIDTLASVVAEQDLICDGCQQQRATGPDRLCDRCALDNDFALGLVP
jgi:hypothetical protein